MTDKSFVTAGASAEFADLVSQLLGKNPATRIGWPQLRVSANAWKHIMVMDCTLERRARQSEAAVSVLPCRHASQ